MQVGDGHASIRQVGHAGVERHAGTAQVYRRAAVDRQVHVIATDAVLIVVVDVQGVVAAGGWRERTIERAAITPQGVGHVFAANGHQQAVIAGTAEGVGLAGFKVDQAGRFRRNTGCHAAIGLHVGHGAAAVRSTGGIDH
ncbi:hypothetical protein D3C80_1517390 [compost metagenome]